MKKKKADYTGTLVKYFILIVALTLLFAGCRSKIPHTLTTDYEKRGVRLVAVLPVINESKDQNVTRIVRQKLLNSLYFKGYPRLPFDVVDKRLSEFVPGVTISPGESVSPKDLGAILGVDAVIYSTVIESKIAYGFITSRIVVSIVFEMRNVKTGETLWRVKYGDSERYFDFTKKELELKSSQGYEPLIDKIVEKALGTIPEGPDFPGYKATVEK